MPLRDRGKQKVPGHAKLQLSISKVDHASSVIHRRESTLEACSTIQKRRPAERDALKVAGSQGFEPRLTVPKTEVLPLHHEPNEVTNSRNHTLLVKPSVN